MSFWDAVKYTTGQLNDQETAEYLKAANKVKDENDCKRCNDYKDFLLTYSPSVRFMNEQIERLGGNINTRNIICEKCDDMKSGGFHPTMGILLCQNKLNSQSHAEDTLVHEMVHAYDQCRFEVDWANLRHHACSEIRASSLSGECRMMNQLRMGFFKFGKGHQDCVKRRAAISVSGNPNCPDKETAALVVEQVFESCFKDTRPFDEIYK